MPTTANSAQQFLAIDTVRDNTVVLKDGGLRMVLMCSSLNFALKSTDEQDATIYQYQNFLNSLDFSVEFVIHSRRFNIAPYLESLQERQKEEDHELMKIQIAEYSEFIRTFVDMTNIMSKTFYVIVPFTISVFQKRGVWGGLFSGLGGGRSSNESHSTDSFEERKNQLWQRVDTVIEGLRRFGIRSAPLETEELIELFYGLYNPTEFEKVGTPSGGPSEGKPH